MAAAHDAVSSPSSQQFTTNTSWTHSPVGVPRGIVGIIVGSGQAVDEIASQTYGGVALTPIQFQENSEIENGTAHAFFLGSSIPIGPQTVAITLEGGAAGEYAAWTYSLTATGDTEVVESGVSNANANPEITLPTLAGFTGMAYGGCFTRLGTVGNLDPGAGYTEAGDVDFGANAGGSIYGAKSGANVLVNWVADSWHAAVGLAVQEVTVVETTSISPLNQRRFQRKTLLRM